VSHFTTTETQGDLGLVAFIEETDQVTQLDVVVAIISARTELDFLDLDLLSASAWLRDASSTVRT
jgi:hypothetical protein